MKFSIIGCGRIAERHAEIMCKYGELLSVCDIVETKANALAQRYNASAYYNIIDLLENSDKTDFIAVCTPNGLHAEHSIQILQHGMHVLCEKPMAISVLDCQKMIWAAEKANRSLFVVMQNRFNPPVMALKKTLEEGRLGRIYSVQINCVWNRDYQYYYKSWRGTLDLDGGTLYTQFSHFIDLMYWMVGDIRNVKSNLSNYAHKEIIEFEDTGVVIIDFLNGALGSIHYTVNSFRRNLEGSITVVGEKGTVKIGGEYLNRIDYQEIQDYKIVDLPTGNSFNDYGSYHGSMSNHDKVYQNIMEYLEYGSPIYMNANEAMKTVEIIEKIYAQGRNN
jgi:UDP-N-acetyl-2-amino-2-deoxyglucuronate dehydrogenase